MASITAVMAVGGTAISCVTGAMAVGGAAMTSCGVTISSYFTLYDF